MRGDNAHRVAHTGPDRIADAGTDAITDADCDAGTDSIADTGTRSYGYTDAWADAFAFASLRAVLSHPGDRAQRSVIERTERPHSDRSCQCSRCLLRSLRRAADFDRTLGKLS